MRQLSVHRDEDDQHHQQTVHATLRDVLAAQGVFVASDCDGAGTCGRCRVRVSTVAALTLAERRILSADDMAAGVRLACQLRSAGPLDVAIDDDASDACRLLAIPQGWSRSADALPVTGLAIDVGTTHLRVSLWSGGQRLGARISSNPQARFGADVLARLARAARDPGDAAMLTRLVREAIGASITSLAREHGVSTSAMSRVVVVGNTAMLALLTGRGTTALLDPTRWMAPIDCTADLRPLREAWHLPTSAAIDAVPPLAGFVGSDLLAAVSATGTCDDAGGVLLADFGTNTEVAFWDGHTLHVTSAAGGPAFEGCGISCGMPAVPGAIVRVKPDVTSPTGIGCQVIGDVDPRGLSGSALVDLVACFVGNGALTRGGRLTGAAQRVPVWRGRTEIAVIRRDIDVFQRAKAAIAAAIDLLLTHAGAHAEGVRRLCVCGAFGEYLSPAHAYAIGLLPRVSKGAVELHAHAALFGAEQGLVLPTGPAGIEAVRARAHVVNLAADPRYEDRFIAHLSLRPFEHRETFAC